MWRPGIAPETELNINPTENDPAPSPPAPPALPRGALVGVVPGNLS